MTKLAVFASGSGTNAENIITFFRNSKNITISSVFCNNPDAYVIQRCKKLQVPCHVFNRDDLYHNNKVVNILKTESIDWIILAGFLWKIPQKLTDMFPSKIINIHPALLPNYGGKGMYGHHVHKAVIEAEEQESGITIHYVNENYDEGDIIFQAKCDILSDDTPDTLAKKIHALEQTHFPIVIQQIVEP